MEITDDSRFHFYCSWHHSTAKRRWGPQWPPCEIILKTLPSLSWYFPYHSDHYVCLVFTGFSWPLNIWGNSGLVQFLFCSHSLISSCEYHQCPCLQLPPMGILKSLNLTSESQTHTPGCLPDISMWLLCQRLLKLSLLKSELSISPQKLVFWDFHLHGWWPHLPTFKNPGVFLAMSFSHPLLSTLSLITAIISLEYPTLLGPFTPHQQHLSPCHLSGWDYYAWPQSVSHVISFPKHKSYYVTLCLKAFRAFQLILR